MVCGGLCFLGVVNLVGLCVGLGDRCVLIGLCFLWCGFVVGCFV